LTAYIPLNTPFPALGTCVHLEYSYFSSFWTTVGLGVITVASRTDKYIFNIEILHNKAIIMSSSAPSDIEKNVHIPSSGGNSSERNDFASGATEPRGNWTTRFVDSFKRDPNAHVAKPGQVSNPREYDHLAAAEATANSGLAMKLKGRHLQMIAIGGSIGSSQALT